MWMCGRIACSIACRSSSTCHIEDRGAESGAVSLLLHVKLVAGQLLAPCTLDARQAVYVKVPVCLLGSSLLA